MVFGTRENHEGRFLLENGLDGYIFWVLVVMGGLDLAACDASRASVTGRLGSISPQDAVTQGGFLVDIVDDDILP